MKQLIKLGDLLLKGIAIDAIASTSSFTFETDTQLDARSRHINRTFKGEVEDDLETVRKKKKERLEQHQEAIIGKVNPDLLYRKLLGNDTYLADVLKKEKELMDREVEFEFTPVVVSEDEFQEAYENIPNVERKINDSGLFAKYRDEAGQYNGSVISFNLRAKLRELKHDGFIIFPAEEKEPDTGKKVKALHK